MLNKWTDPMVPDSEAIPYVLETGSLYGSPTRVREQVAELRDVGVRHLLCQTGFGDMGHEQHLLSMRVKFRLCSLVTHHWMSELPRCNRLDIRDQ